MLILLDYSEFIFLIVNTVELSKIMRLLTIKKIAPVVWRMVASANARFIFNSSIT